MIFGVVGIYSDFFKNNDPKIQYDILSNAAVVDIKENIGKIDILYDSTSILTKKQTLSLITIRIANTGNANVLKNFYDLKFPLGMKIEGGVILERPTIIQSSSEYLKQSIGLQLINQDAITFSDFIFEKNDFFVLKLLVLHGVNVQPSIVAFGKIAGAKQIEITKTYADKDSQSFIDRVAEGNPLVHITRFIIYFILLIVLMLIIILPIALIDEWLNAIKRKKILAEFTIYLRHSFTKPQTIITDFYLDSGVEGIKMLKRICDNFSQFDNQFQDSSSIYRASYSHMRSMNPYKMGCMIVIEKLEKADMATISGNKVILKGDLYHFIDQLIKYATKEK